MKSGSLKKILEDLSLSNYEISVVEFLFSYGDAKADEIHENTRIPLSRVYETVDQLNSKGFIIIQPGRPKIFQIRDPSESVKNLIESEKKKYNERLSKLNKTGNLFIEQALPLYLEKNTLISPNNLLFQFHGLKQAEDKTIDMINSAKETIEIFTNVFNWFTLINTEIVKALTHGVLTRIVMQQNIPNQIIDLTKKFSNLKVRKTNNLRTKSRGTIIDNKEVVFIIWANEPGSSKDKSKRIYRPQFSSNDGIVGVFKNNFEYLWEQSIK